MKWTLTSLALAMMLASMGTSMTSVALPTLAAAFGASVPAVQWIVIAYLLGMTTMIVSAGHVGDVVGRRKLLLAGLLLFSTTSIACGLAPNLTVLIVARVGQGIGGAVMMALSLALVSHAVPRERTGAAMGLLGSMSAFGTALGPSLGGLLITQSGWRGVFLVNAPLGLMALLLVRWHVPRDNGNASDRRHRDLFGAASSIALMRGSALRNALLASAIVSTVMMATLVVGPFYLSRALGLSTTGVGLAMTVGPLVTALTGMPAGRITDRLGTPRMTTLGLGGIALGLLLVIALPAGLGVLGYVIPIGVTTAGYACFQTANNAWVMSQAHEAQRGAVAGLLSLSRNVGLIAGASAMGVLFAATGMRVTFAVAALLAMLALTTVSRGEWRRQ